MDGRYPTSRTAQRHLAQCRARPPQLYDSRLCRKRSATAGSGPRLRWTTTSVRSIAGLLRGGVTGSPNLDGHRKSMSYHLLTLEI
ncbi:hypothetical protein [Brevibacterium antiquum]|uniref:hypothetical protein n=1 Tax=Brevibacterium antiquum TaxID=234835 RepID=UPI0011AFB6AB|nr:hypothetical protein [Brevibacterium antiquum]